MCVLPTPICLRRERIARYALLLLVCFGGMAGFCRATSVRAPEFSALVNDSDYIVRAKVQSVRSEFIGPGGRKIVTWVELEVREIIAGVPPSPLVLRILGGKVGDREMILEGAPRFEVGEESILFVQGNGRQIYPLVAMMHGIYPIKREESGREFVTRGNRVPLQSTAEVAIPMVEGNSAQLQLRLKHPAQALTPVQFAREIRAAVKSDNTRLREP